MKRYLACLVLAFLPLLSFSAFAQGREDVDDRVVEESFNDRVVATVNWMADNKAGLGYDLGARYTEDLKYGDYVLRANRQPSTMCVAAVLEVMVRALADAVDAAGNPVSKDALPGSMLDGASALHLLPYIFQFESRIDFPEYRRKFSAGAGDAFVLFGIGRYVSFDEAKPGDFLYFNRTGGSGHASIFMGYLDQAGSITASSADAKGFRYFSAQRVGTNGLGYRDAFFGACPEVETKYVKDCGVIKSTSRALFSVSRIHQPTEWFTSFSAIRIDRFFNGDSIDSIYADEPAFRSRAVADLEQASRDARDARRRGVFPLIPAPIVLEEMDAKEKLAKSRFRREFGPNFEE